MIRGRGRQGADCLAPDQVAKYTNPHSLVAQLRVAAAVNLRTECQFGPKTLQAVVHAVLCKPDRLRDYVEWPTDNHRRTKRVKLSHAISLMDSWLELKVGLSILLDPTPTAIGTKSPSLRLVLLCFIRSTRRATSTESPTTGRLMPQHR